MDVQEIIERRARQGGMVRILSTEVDSVDWNYRIRGVDADGREVRLEIPQLEVLDEKQFYRSRQEIRDALPNLVRETRWDGMDFVDAMKFMTATPRDFIEARQQQPTAQEIEAKQQEAQRKARQEMVLIVGFDRQDSEDCARMLGIEQWQHVARFQEMAGVHGRSIYITERGRDRADYGAIEGLFLRGGHTVTDLMD